MCQFCENIYPENDISDVLFGRGKYKSVAMGGSFIIPDAFIAVDENGKLDIAIDGGDSCEVGWVCDIKFRPYCGRNLQTKTAEFHCGVEESGGHAYNCNDCPNKCDEWHRWDKEFESAKRKKENKE